MGNKYEVTVWGRHWGEKEGYSDRQIWQGEWLISALWQLWRAKRLGFGCTSLKIR